MADSILVNPAALTGATQRVTVPMTAFKSPNVTTRIVFPNAGAVKTYGFQVQSTASVGGTSPTLDAKLQTSYDGGVTWVDIASGAAAQITAASQVKTPIVLSTVHGDMLAILLTTGGTAKAAVAAVAPTGANNDVDWSTVATDGSTDSAVTGTIKVGYQIANDTAIAAYTFPKASNSLSVAVTGTGTALDPKIVMVTLGTGTGTKASATTVLAGANNDLVFTAKKAGVWANGAAGGVTVTYVDPSPLPSQALVVNVSGGDIVVGLATGAGTKQAFSTSLTGNNNDLDWTAASVATTDLTITYVDPAASNMPLSISKRSTLTGLDTHDIVVNLATNSSGTITTIASDIIAILALHGGISALITAANHSGNDGSGVVTAMSKQSLTGAAAPVATSTSAQIATAVAALPAANALVDVTNSGGDTGAGVVTAMSKANLASGVDPVGTSTASQVTTLVNADGTAGALVQGANHGADTGAGAITVAMAPVAATGGAVYVGGQLDVDLITV